MWEQPAGSVSDQVVEDELEPLAQQRAGAVSTYLIKQARIDAARIHLQPVQINLDETAWQGRHRHLAAKLCLNIK